MTETTRDGWHELLDEIDRKHAEAHARLRGELSALEVTVSDNHRQSQIQADALRGRMSEVAQLATTPVDGGKLVWPTKVIVSVVFASIAVGGAAISGALSYASTQNEVKSLRGEMTAVREVITNTSKQSDERYDRLQHALDEMKRQREEDRREAAQKMSDFLNQSLQRDLARVGGKK
jgi:alcohol dehydrogenase class IV